MKKFLIALLAFGIIGSVTAPANAQQPQALIVSACGTPPVSYVAGTYGILTMDTTGKLCDSGSGGGGGTVTANQGTAGSSAWLVTGAGGTFPVTGTFWPYTLGQQLAAASVPVVLTAAQLTTLTPPTTIAVTQSGAWTVGLNTTPTIANGNGVVHAPSSESLAGLSTSATSVLASNLAVKASAGNLYSFNVGADSTLSGAAWWLMIFNLASAPADGAVTPAKCYPFPSGTTGYSAAFPVPVNFSTGITLVVSTTGCFTKTASAHAFLSGDFK
jgi:hypothetical protein